MRILLLLLFMGVGFANAQYSPTTSKVRFVYGIAFRTGDTANFKTAVDTNIVVMHLDSSLYYRNKGVFKAIGGSTAAYKLIADTLFNNGYTTRVRDRFGLDSLGALKLNVSDTASMLSPYARTSNLPSITGKLNISDTSSMLSPYRRTSTAITQSEVTGLTSALAGKLNISDTATMLSRGWLANRSLDTATALQSRIQTKQPLLTNPITGTGTSGQVAYWNGTSTQTGSSSMTYNGSSEFILSNSINGGIKSSITNSNTGVSASSFFEAFNNNNSYFQMGVLGSNNTSGGIIGGNDIFLQTAGNATSIVLRTTSAIPVRFATNQIERGRFSSGGNLLVATTTDNGVDNVQVNGSLIATTLKSTTNTVSGNSTIGGTLDIGATGTYGSVGLKRSSDGAISSYIRQTTDNQLNIESGGGTAIIKILANTINFDVPGANAIYNFGQNRPTSSQILINGSNNNKLRIQNNETDIIVLNSFDGTVTAIGATLSALSGTGDRVVVASSTGVLSASQIVTSGTYTPTVTNGTNVSSSTTGACQFMRVGNTVTVSGSISITATAASTASIVYITLPVASALTAIGQAAGTSGTSFDGTCQGVIAADHANDRVYLIMQPNVTVSREHSFHFTYQIL